MLVHGTDEKTVFAAELELRNLGQTALVVSLSRITLGIDRGAVRAESERNENPIAAGIGSLPESIDDFKVAPPVSIAPGQRQTVWVAFKNVAKANVQATQGLKLQVAVDGAEPLQLKLSDPADAGPRWTINRPSGTMSVAFMGAVLDGKNGDIGIGGPGISTAAPLPWTDASLRVTTSPMLVEGGEESGGGVWSRWQLQLPLPWARERKGWSLAPTLGLDLAYLSFDKDRLGLETERTFALGYNVGITLLIDMDRAFLGSFPLEPQRSNIGRTFHLSVGAMHTWGLLPGDRSPAAGIYTAMGFGFL